MYIVILYLYIPIAALYTILEQTGFDLFQMIFHLSQTCNLVISP